LQLQKKRLIKLNWDKLGITASLLCAIHCALLPLVTTSLPIFGVNIVKNQAFEWGMIFITLLVGVYSLYHGYVKHHKKNAPFIIFFIGFLFLVLKQIFATAEYYLLLVAICAIVFAHYKNYLLCHKSKCTSSHHAH
jgi:hypothetical protein